MCPSKPRKSNFFWRDVPGFCRDIPGAPEKFEKKKFVFNSRPLEKTLTTPLNPEFAIDTEIKAKRNNITSGLKDLQNYESESESKIRGEVSVWA